MDFVFDLVKGYNFRYSISSIRWQASGSLTTAFELDDCAVVFHWFWKASIDSRLSENQFRFNRTRPRVAMSVFQMARQSAPPSQDRKCVFQTSEDAYQMCILHIGWRPSLLGWRPLLLGWRPSLLGWRPSLLGWRLSLVIRLEAIAIMVEAIAIRLEAIAIRLEAIAIRLEAVAIRLEANRVEAIAIRVEAIAIRLEAIAIGVEAIAIRLEAIAIN